VVKILIQFFLIVLNVAGYFAIGLAIGFFLAILEETLISKKKG